MFLATAVVQAHAAVSPLSVGISKTGSGASVSLGWTASPSTNVTGYFLNWGLLSGQCTNQLDVGNVTNTTVSGLASNTTYYFNVVAYDAAGDQAPPSNELAYQVAAAPPPPPAVQLQPDATNPNRMWLSFQAAAGESYVIEASQDLKNWQTILTTNASAAGLISVIVSDSALYPQRFYRVGRQTALPLALKLQSGSGNGGAFAVSFLGSAGKSYAIQATQDFKQWTTVWTTNVASAGPLVYTPADLALYPRRFYRVWQL